MDRLGAVRSGTNLGRYTLLRRLGAGGMGEVYEAMEIETREIVAIKVLRSTGAAALARCDGSNEKPRRSRA